ncbi:hypothetical protein [Legionella qingyii]|nr:hypothetical protein [Legionella qingyii]
MLTLKDIGNRSDLDYSCLVVDEVKQAITDWDCVGGIKARFELSHTVS